MKSVHKQQGVSLIEVILVLIISVGILYLSIQQYLAYRQDANIVQVRANVDALFIALTNYFRANCNNPNSNLYNFYMGNLAVNMNTLVSGGYLTASINANPLVDSSGPGQGYILQFNQYYDTTQTNPPLPRRTVNMSPSGTANVGNINIWQAQVAVKLLHPTASPTFQAAMAADCISSSFTGWGGGTVVTPCSLATPGATDYLVWTRAPSFSSSTANSPYWLSMPVVKQFGQMYTTYPILILTGQTQPTVQNQYYRCGS